MIKPSRNQFSREGFVTQELRRRKEVRTILTRRCFLTLLIACLTVGLSFAETREPLTQQLDSLSKIRGRFSFAVVGDTRSGGDDYGELIQRMMEHRPDFIVNLGDMVRSANRASWVDFWNRSKPIAVPYFLTVGNHDVYDEKSEELYKRQVDLPGNELYYSFAADDSLFIVLDSNIPGQDRRITGEQYKWLEGVLSTSRQRHTFVYLHHPLYPEKGRGHHYGGSLDKYPKERDRLQELFVKYNVTIVFAGHEHLYLRKVIAGVTEIITGGGGATLYAGEGKGGFHHFILVTVDGDKVEGDLIDINEKVKDTFRL